MLLVAVSEYNFKFKLIINLEKFNFKVKFFAKALV